MAPFPIPTLVAQSMSAIYNPCKDLFLYLKGQRQDIKDLEDRLSTLITDLMSIVSRKEAIDQSLRTSVSTEKSKEYTVMETNIAIIRKKYTEFINKYASITGNLPSPTDELDVSTATDMITKLEDMKSKIWTLNFRKLAKLSRDIAKLSKRASGILDELKLGIAIQKKSESNQEKLHDNNDLPVFNTYVDEVLSYLSENRNRVGIVGPVGVGKTIVLTKLLNKLIETKSLSNGDNTSRLDNIIWTEYPLELETEEKIAEKLQNEFMVQLKIDHERTNSIYQNAIIISTFLRPKKYILLLDQVSNYIDLNKLGLREDHEHGNVVVASSDKKAISLMIEDEVEIQRLLKKDAWKLFENICGKIYDSHLIAIADRIIECCGGIAQEIKFVANFLKSKKDESSWTDVKQILQSDTKSLNLIGLGGIDKIYKLTYEKLEMSSKKCLLYGALFPNQYRIYRDYLIECWIAEGFMVENVVQKLRRNRDRGQTILNELTDRYLLEWCSDKKYVKMPPNFRRVALEQEYPSEEKCVIWVPSNDQKPNKETWTTVTRMSLIGCNTNLPESPQCCNIYTLLLQSKSDLNRLADWFFFHMQNLQVLDLSHTDIGALPRSIYRLVNLRGLYLNGCYRLDMLPPEAAQLKKLEFLDICGTSIPSLPQEIRYMIDLRCLRASFSPRDYNHNSKGKEVEDPEVIIPPNIICNLSKLEELSIDIGFHNQGMIDMAKQLAMELASLEYLTTLRFNFPNMSSFNAFVTHSKSLKNIETGWGTHTFRSFKISVGCHKTQHPYESDVSEVSAERQLRFSTNEEFSSNCREVLKQAYAFELIGHDSVETLSKFDSDSLKVCVIESCNHLKSIVDGYTINEMGGGIVEESSRGVLRNLEKLHLYDLQLLQYIWEGPILSQSLINLTFLILNGCPKLTKILDPPLARTLPSLKHLKVEDCCEISEIVEVCEGSNNSEQVDLSGILKGMEIIELSNLPKLQSICTSTSINWNSLNSICIIRCNKLSNLSLTQTNAKKLASIECEKSWWTPLQLPDGVKQHFLQFCHFRVESSVLGDSSKGETSTIGRSVFNQASSKIDLVILHGEERDPASNINVDNCAECLEEMPINDDLLAPNIYAEVDSSRPEDEIQSIAKQKTFGHLTSIRP